MEGGGNHTDELSFAIFPQEGHPVICKGSESGGCLVANWQHTEPSR